MTFDPSRVNEETFSYYRRLGRVRDFVHRDLSRKITLATVADIAGNERCYFCRFFRRTVGVCFTTWLAHVRVGAAMKLLAERNRTITQVALSVGFADASHLAKVFQKHRGMTPSEYQIRCSPGESTT